MNFMAGRNAHPLKEDRRTLTGKKARSLKQADWEEVVHVQAA